MQRHLTLQRADSKVTLHVRARFPLQALAACHPPPRHKKPAPRSSAGRALRRHIVAQAALPRLGGVVVNGGQRSAVSICVSVHKSTGTRGL
jgi:hypothetical protein